MNTTSADLNRAHRNDAEWIKSKGRRFDVDGHEYVSEYRNPWTGWAIRKSWGTGLGDGRWFIFDATGTRRDRSEATLTWAKATVELETA